MPIVPALQTIVSPGKALSAPVIANFNSIRQYVNDYVLFKDVASQTVTVAVTFSAGLTVSASGITVTGNSTITGTLGGLTGLTVASGGITVTSGSLTLTSGNATLTSGNLTLTAGHLSLAAGQANCKYYNAGDSGSALTINWNNGNEQRVRLTASAPTLTLSNPVAGAYYVLHLVQDATGSRLLPTFSPTLKVESNGTNPTLTTTASRKDKLLLFYNGTDYEMQSMAFNFNTTN